MYICETCFKICTQSCPSYIFEAQNLFFISYGETEGNLIESKKIDVHGMPNSREKTETLCQNGSLMRHFGTCSCNEIRATFVPFAKNCRARISSSWRKAPETCGILDYMKTQTATCASLRSLSLNERKTDPEKLFIT